MKNDFHQLLETAINATEISNAVLNKETSFAKSVQLNTDHDIKITGDRLSENTLTTFLAESTGFPMISEETGEIAGNSNEKVWVIDPIDGSLNYSRGIPLSCISIALWENDRPLLGVIRDLNRDELFSGIVGEGAWLNDQPIYVSKVDKTQDAIIATGFPSKTNFSSASLASFISKVQNFKKIRQIGSAALSTAYVAAGRFDAYIEKGIMLWDVAAGIAITKAAGGCYSMQKSADKFQFDVIVSNRKLSDLLILEE